MRIPPFKGKVHIVQTCHPFQYEGNLSVTNCPGTFVKYTIAVLFEDLKIVEIYEIAVRTLKSAEL